MHIPTQYVFCIDYRLFDLHRDARDYLLQSDGWIFLTSGWTISEHGLVIFVRMIYRYQCPAKDSFRRELMDLSSPKKFERSVALLGGISAQSIIS